MALTYLGRHEAAESVAGGIRNTGGQALAIRADIAVEPDILRLFETTDRELGPVTALVNNAATLEAQ